MKSAANAHDVGAHRKKLRAEYDANLLVEYNCRWDKDRERPKSISNPKFFETPFQSPQPNLFEPFWNLNPKLIASLTPPKQLPLAVGQQLELYFGPKILK